MDSYIDHTAKLKVLMTKIDALADEVRATRKLMEEHDEWERKGTEKGKGDFIATSETSQTAPDMPTNYAVALIL